MSNTAILPYDFSETKNKSVSKGSRSFGILFEIPNSKFASPSKFIPSKVEFTRLYDSRRYSLTDYKRNKLILNNFLKLEENWNLNKAQKFSSNLINKSLKLLAKMEFQPQIFPTSRNSIQFEYEKENGDYLEVEIFDKSIQIYQNKNNCEIEKELNNFDDIKKTVGTFHT